MSGLVDAIFGGGGDAPPPPDYAAAAKATAQGNKEAAQFAVNANRINQYTPYGSLTYSRKQPTFDQAGYDKAMQNYQNSLSQRSAQPQQSSQLTGSGFGFKNAPSSNLEYFESGGANQDGYWRNGFNSEGQFQEWVPGQQGSQQAQLSAPRREDFTLADDGGGWEQRMELTPQAQATLDKQMALSDKYAETAGIGFDRARAIFENPNIDTSGMPEFTGVDLSQLARAPINPGMTAQEALLSRLNPSLASDEEALRTRLVNQGIGLGSTAYGREMGLQGQRGTDLRLQAAAQGISLDQAARQQGLNEQLAIAGLNSGQRAQMLQEAYTKQSRPLDMVNALRSGAQVSNPTFQPYAQQQYVGGPNTLGAAQAQYGAQMDAYNADQAASSGLLGGIAGIGMGLAGLPGAGGSILKGAKGLFG